MSFDKKDFCYGCINIKICQCFTPWNPTTRYCNGLEKLANGNSPRKEDLANDLWNNGYVPLERIDVDDDCACPVQPRDYKETCIQLGGEKVDEHTAMHDNIMAMPDDRTVDLIKKAVAALAFFEVSAAKSMRVLRLAERTFYRYFRGK